MIYLVYWTQTWWFNFLACVSHRKRCGKVQRSRIEEETCINGTDATVQKEQGQFKHRFTLLLSFIVVIPAAVLYASWWLNHLTGHCASDPLIDRNSRSQIKPDSVSETSDSKDGSTSPAENAAPKEEAGSTPDLGKHPPLFQFDHQMCLLDWIIIAIGIYCMRHHSHFLQNMYKSC